MRKYQKNEYCFIDEWNEHVPINWWKESRKKLNKIIHKFNLWQIKGFRDDKVRELLALIEWGKQTIGSQDGGSGYMEELEKMEHYVRSRTE